MKFMLFILPTVPGTLEDRKRLRPIGRNTERYQQMLDEMRKLAVLADDAGFDVFATTEHHFHSEGYETSVAPLLLYADLAARTRRIKFAPLGLVLPAWDPIRAAEELAVLDQLTKGRLYAGFARGYQDRWVNVLGQQYHVTGAPMDGSAIDQHGEVLSLLDNETGMHSCLEPKTQASPVGAGGKRRHPRAHENTGIGADEPEA